MTPKERFDWQTAGGTADIWFLIESLERAHIPWCVIGRMAVNHWVGERLVTPKMDFVATASYAQVAELLIRAHFQSERLPWSVKFKRRSKVSLRLSTNDFYRDHPSRSVAADIHGMLMRVASLEDTLNGKLHAWAGSERRPAERAKEAGEIARLVAAHPRLCEALPGELQSQLRVPHKPVLVS